MPGTVGRGVARIATLIALLGAVGCASPPISMERQIATVLSRAIQIPTVNPPGDERPLAEYYASVLTEAGIEARIIETPAGDSIIGRAAVWGVIRGSGTEKRPIVLLSHLDVVPVDAEEWEDDPFGGIERDGYVIGRGALDAKGVSVVHLMTMLELSRREVPLDRDVIFLSTPDEESGGVDGAGYIAKRQPELLEYAEYLLTEGGGILDRSDPDPDLWRVGVVEKSPCWIKLTSTGQAGHSSVPPRDAAVPRLISALERISEFEHPIRVVPEVQVMYEALAPLAAPDDAAAYLDLERYLREDPAFRSRFMTLRYQAALVTNTLTPTVLEGSSRTNVLPSTASAHLDGRLLPGERCERFTDRLGRAISDPGITFEVLLSFDTRGSGTNNSLYRAIEAVAAREDPPAPTVPTVTIGFTDAHYFRDIGITSYGFLPRALRPEDSRGVHGNNERAALAPLAKSVETMLAILDELGRASE